MLIYTVNHWAKSKLFKQEFLSLFDRCAKEISNALKLKTNYCFDVIIVNKQQIQRINHKFRHKNEATDVISFALWDANEIKTPLLGEIYLSLAFIKKYSEENNLDFVETLLLNYIHGILHLFQFDHTQKHDANKMFKLQNKILSKVIKK